MTHKGLRMLGGFLTGLAAGVVEPRIGKAAELAEGKIAEPSDEQRAALAGAKIGAKMTRSNVDRFVSAALKGALAEWGSKP